MRRYASKRLYAWSHSIAYSVGLMTSDGCLSRDGRHLDLTSVDIEQLENFSKALGRTFVISDKTNTSNTPAYRVQFSDVAYYDFLLAAGLTPAKSKTISTLTIPDDFYADFLRGLFDGDGSCYAYMDKRWRSSYMYYVSFTSASMDFILYLQGMNARLIGTESKSIRKAARAYSLVYAKRDAYMIFKYMYHHTDVICLKRKYNKLLSFTVRNGDGIIH